MNDTEIALDDLGCPKHLVPILMKFHGADSPELYAEHEACHVGEIGSCILCNIGA